MCLGIMEWEFKAGNDFAFKFTTFRKAKFVVFSAVSLTAHCAIVCV